MTQQQQDQSQPMMAAYPTFPATTTMTATPTFRRLRVRHKMFKVGVGGVLLSTVLFIVGYSAPAWVYQQGLWQTCDNGVCVFIVGQGPDWLNAVRAMESMALVFLLICVSLELYQDVILMPPPPDNKAVELLAGLAGTLGMIGVTIYGAKVSPKVYSYHGYGDIYWRYIRINIQWGYGLTTAACMLLLICSLLIGCSRVKHAEQTQQAMAAAGILVRGPAPSAPPMIAMQPMTQPMQMSSAGLYPSLPTNPTPYTYPAHPTTPLISPPPVGPTPMAAIPTPQGMPTSQAVFPAPDVAATQGMPTSQVPAFYVMTQGHMVPVYHQMPPTSTTTGIAGAPQNV